MPILPDQLRLVAERHPHEVAYRVIGTGEMTFDRWWRQANRIARTLTARGVGPGDRVALLFEAADTLRRLQASVGAQLAGGISVPLSTALSAAELAAIGSHAEPAAVLASPSLAERARQLGAVDVTVIPAGDGPDGWGDVLVDDDRPVDVPVTEDDPADIIYTSGTTGRPKGVLVRHANGAQLPIAAPTWTGKVWFHASPMSTSAGAAFSYVPMQLGMTGCYLPRFDPEVFCDLAEAGAIHTAFLVPAMVERLLGREDLSDRDLSSLEIVSVGSAPVAPSTLLALAERVTNGMVFNGYALTESGAGQFVLPATEIAERPGSVGRPMPPAEVRIVGDDGGEVAIGEVGEVTLRTDTRPREYFRDPEATERTWRDGWLHTGDLGFVDADGYLYLAGRSKELIIRGGSNVFPADVEAVLYEHPDVSEAAVVGVPDAELGEEIAAAVVLRPGATTDPDQLRAWCRERLSSYKVPRIFDLRDELPRNQTGKVLKRQLSEELAPTGDAVSEPTTDQGGR